MNILLQIIDFIQQGGIISYIIVALYFFVMSITVERSIYFIRSTSNFSRIEKMLASVENEAEAQRLAQTKQIAGRKKSQVVILLNHYLDTKKLHEKAFHESLERKAFMLIADMERHIWLLSQIGHISPLLGLLGTVVGLIEAFRMMSTIGASVDVASFAGGIWVAMITTALGLIVAIPSFLIFRIFEKIVEKRSTQMSYVVSVLNERFSDNCCAEENIAFNEQRITREDIHETF
ncbi:MAG: MotA/TolQ/ExbB proton channel family protein [Spirochaetales bacterium]